MWTTAWVDHDRYGRQRHPWALRACDQAQPRARHRTGGPFRPDFGNDFRYDNA